ncbi:MAG: 2-hydroxy-3-oxopropionate reductase [Gemmatimonadetes bacterium]|jgi:2-hydroxy-3-oxopropionate reductase|nr:2-hydroxy-3-oxopropionate reductase [Gemmatimonadota bacterium]
MEKTQLGFIGLGIMGKPMAINLHNAGYSLVVHDVNAEPVAELTDLGAKRATSPAEVGASCDIVLTMLPNSPHVATVVTGGGGLLESARDGQIIIDMSSIAPLVSQNLSKELASKGAHMLDAPVSGGQEKAELGTLAFMVGGEQGIFDTCKPILDIMGGSVTRVGDIGAGQTTKLVNQAIVGVNIAIIAEAMSLGKKAGVDPEAIFNAIRGGLAASACLEDKAPRMFEGRFDPGFRINLHVKDLANVAETSRQLHVAMPLSSQVMEMMQAMLAAGHDDVDHGGLALYYEQVNGFSLKE